MQALIEGPRRSKLTFAHSQESTEPVCFNRLRRVREPVSRSKAGVQGKVADVIGGRSRHAESLNELQAFRVLLATAHADAWQEQPFTLEYHTKGEKRRYTPDLLVVWGARREVVEIKEDSEADLPENQARFALIRELLTEHGYHFRLWKKSEICAEPRLTNAGLILRYRSVEVSAVERERIRRAFSATPEVRLQHFPRNAGNHPAKRASPGSRGHAAYRLVGTANAGLSVSITPDWAPSMALPGAGILFRLRRRHVATCVEKGTPRSDRAKRIRHIATAE